jgi:hypothetical protein
MAQDLGLLTDTWMTNPYMFEPSQLSNPYSNYGGSALPWPPTYNTGLAGGPVNAATGKPIQSFQQWQQQNPGGLSINSTPAQPQAPANPLTQAASPSGLNSMGLNPAAYAMGLQGPSAMNPSGNAALFAANWGGFMPMGSQGGGGGGQPQAAPQAAPQASGPPNNWQAAINALANPGNPVTQGANVPMVTGSQPAGGVNNAFLQQAGAGQGMNQNFLSALRAIQARPQQ